MRTTMGWLAILTLGLSLGQLPGQEPKPDDTKKDDTTKKDEEALQGLWELDQLEVAGKKVMPEDLKKAAARIEIKGTSITFTSDPGKEGRKGTFTLDTSKTPSWIDLEDGKSKELGIYEIKDDTFKVCAAKITGERPKEFASKAMPESNLMVFKRIKK